MMLPNNCKLLIKITLLLFYAIENSADGDCKPLISTASTTFICKNHKTWGKCTNPIEGTEVLISCNEFYEMYMLESKEKLSCTKNGWDILPECYPKKRPKDIFNNSSDQNELLDFPWHVGIYDKSQKLLCGGTIIDMDIVLTAANCVAYYDSNQIYSLQDLKIVSGKYYNGFDDKRDIFFQVSEVKNIEVPKEYKGKKSSYAFNIAILTLEKSFVPSPVVKPICINFNRIAHNVLFEDNGLITGWGSSSDVKVDVEELKEIKVSFIPNNKCSTKMHKNFVKYVTDDKICESNLDNKTTVCIGDNGGGVAFRSKKNGRYYLIGIVSWTPTTEEDKLKCDPNQFSISTSISYHKDFLKNFTAINNHKIQSCHLPDFPPHGVYSLIDQNNTNASVIDKAYEPGQPVPSDSKLKLICQDGYNFTSPEGNQFYCSIAGQWFPTLGGCTQGLEHKQIISPLDKSGSSFNYIHTILIVTIAILFVIALVAVIVLNIKFRKEKELRNELKSAGLDHFQHGELEKFNPELDIGEQAELLPYNYNYEFPMDKLELSKQLGSGAFGVVTKAYAYGINSYEEKTKVAVKTVKDAADNIQIKALISELKIMIHLGQHLNVVNLLGACTQNITKRKLLVIVEYCPFGNLYNYLLRNRPNFINQIDNVTGTIDYSFGVEDLESGLPISNSASDRNSTPHTHNRNRLESRYKYSRKYKKVIKPLYTKDLISWSFQIARGMEYLSSRMIVHGDLAARNLLLSENNVIKICDFGLAKQIYQNYHYKKHKDSPLPIKWMAIESIRDLVFSTKSDVWSYGIVLWELFSLAQTPYPGMEADEKLYRKLLDGYQMESPPYAPKELYKIMCDCWNINPSTRPSFNQLTGTVGLLLEENIRQHYIELNDPYLVMNTERLNKDQEDYIAMKIAKFQERSFSSNYINRNIVTGDSSVKTSNSPAVENPHKIPNYIGIDIDIESERL